jgi:threonine/homoserine/homoserine lactone efflux protein
VLLILYRIVDVPGPDIPAIVQSNVDFGRKIGLFLGLVAAAGVVYGGYRSLGESPQTANTPPAVPAQ